ncbi:NHL repeat-containing protein [Mucilaginibacter agri]|uniref:IPT/TIG domain-containing protein n=1 Tax=Mucilaginibacter agri TaxID=2695265 RepID=A0A965ZCY6_9SPHI|nr:hypothetical protein [Mucilaginibacter agri]NCD67993.1 hypothetical protein [Mucilaginibacter agri]
MKRIFTLFGGLFLFLMIVTAVPGCKKDKSAPETLEDKPNSIGKPVVSAIRQHYAFNELGKPVYSLTIAGTNFNKKFQNYKVLFNDVAAPAIAGDSLHFDVTIPDAIVATESKLTIVMDGNSTVYTNPFKVEQLQPTISTLSANAGMRNSSLVITGALFSPVLSENAVTINGVKATVNSVKVIDYEGSTGGAQVFGNIYTSVDRKINAGVALNITIPANASNGKLVVTSYGKTVAYGTDIDILHSTFTSSPSTLLKSISLDDAGNIYGTVKNKLVKVTPAGTISTLATIGDSNVILGDCVADAKGNVYVASGDDYTTLPDVGNHNMPLYRPTEVSSKIFKITSTGTVSVFAGSTNGIVDGQGINAKFRSPTHIVRNAKTGDLYVTDALVIRKIAASGLVTTLAGSNSPVGTGYTSGFKDGQGTAAGFLDIYSMMCDASTGNLYVLDVASLGLLRRITPDGYVSTVPVHIPNYTYIGGPGTAGMAMDVSNNILVASNGGLFKIENGNAFNTSLNPYGEAIYGMTTDGSGNIYLNTGEKVYKIVP